MSFVYQIVFKIRDRAKRTGRKCFFLMKQRTSRLSERQKIFYFATPEKNCYRNRI